jgi:uncharacterized protein YqgC (DUF456 family)
MAVTMIWICYLLLLGVAAVGLLVNIVGLPGLWLIVASLAGYAWLTGFDVYVGWPSLISVLVLAGLAEVAEFVAGSAGAAEAGGSKRAMLGAIVGGVLGGVLLSIPIPLIGAIIGACLGAFLGSAVIELAIRRDLLHSMRVGTGAAKGRFWGIVIKLAFGAVMLLVVAVAAWPVRSSSGP